MDFETFQSACKWASYGFEEETGLFELTCRKPECIPKGESWGKCGESYCPFFGFKVQDGVFIDEKTNNVLMIFQNGSLIWNE